MSGFDSKRQASKSLLEQALDALELARDAHCLPGTPTTLVYQAIDAIRAELAQENPWRDAIDAELIRCHIGTVESFPTAKYALNELINWYVKVALDPEVSSAAKALVDRGAAVAEPLTEWQPIETAPKNGTDILGMYMHIETQIVHNIFWLDDKYEPEENGWWTYEYSEVSRMKLEGWMLPTHWIPLPAARGIKGSAA